MTKLSIENAIKLIKDLTGHARPSEDFDGRKGGIWFSGENTVKTDIDGSTFDLPVYDSYGEFESYYGDDLHPRVKDILDRAGLYMEPYDTGTCMAWPH